jgi:hypothetical protein
MTSEHKFDMVGGIIVLYMTFILILWLSQASAINPIGTNTTITGKYAQAYTNTKWFLALIAPLGGYIIFNQVRHRFDEDEGESEEE